MLEAIGLDAEHESVYRALLAVPSADVTELSRASGLPLVRVQRALDGLEQHGLAARQASAPDRVVASPPAVALRPVLAEREQWLSDAQDALVGLSELYRTGAAQRSAPDIIDVVHGADAVRQRIAQLQAAASERLDAFVLSDIAVMSSDENIEEERALARGVKYRVVVEADVLERPGFLAAVREAYDFGEEVRVLPSLLTRMFIVDDELALLPMQARGEQEASGALLVHPSALLDLLIATFDDRWRAATVLVDQAAQDAASSDGIDRDLLRLLRLGMTDAAAGAQLGISSRTVQRRIAELMDRANVSNRFQLGSAAERLGWL